tara:strand:+ start:13327 stop:13701 length:375 start_codon:yes stop_codon:yes gene_type:complete
MSERQYLNIKEVSQLLNIKEHVIRYWDSIDPRTSKLRIEGLSIRNKGGKRYFNKENIKKLKYIKNIIFENGKHNYSLDLAIKLFETKKSRNHTQENNLFYRNISNKKSSELENIIVNLKKLKNI